MTRRESLIALAGALVAATGAALVKSPLLGAGGRWHSMHFIHLGGGAMEFWVDGERYGGDSGELARLRFSGESVTNVNHYVDQNGRQCVEFCMLEV